MKTQLLLIIACVTLVNSIVFSAMPGCGAFRTLPLALGWHLVSACRGHLFADNHASIVAAVGALLSACFIGGLLLVLALTLWKSVLTSASYKITMYLAVGAAIYVALGLLPFPTGPCF